MEKQLARPYYQDTGRRPYLYYAVIGIDGEAELEISRSRHRVDEVPAGLVIKAFRRAEHAAEMDQLLGGALGQVLENQDRALYEKAKAGETWLILQGEVQKDDTLDYLRNAVGIVQAALDMGADAVLDLHALRLISPQGWKTFFDPPFSPLGARDFPVEPHGGRQLLAPHPGYAEIRPAGYRAGGGAPVGAGPGDGYFQADGLLRRPGGGVYPEHTAAYQRAHGLYAPPGADRRDGRPGLQQRALSDGLGGLQI